MNSYRAILAVLSLALVSVFLVHRIVQGKPRQRVSTVEISHASLTSTTATPTYLNNSEQGPSASAPLLITNHNSTRAIAFESTTFVREPFFPTYPHALNLGSDRVTRISLFAMNVGNAFGDINTSSVTANAEDSAHNSYPLLVEFVGDTPGYPWLKMVNIRLNENMGLVGDVLIGIKAHRGSSNRVRVGIGFIGSGPPDDSPPTPVPAALPIDFPTPIPPPDTTYYVSLTGSDSNPGSQSQPFRTLAKGVSVLKPGDTLFVRAGTYTWAASVNIPDGTSWSQPVTIKTYPGETAVITAQAGDHALSFDHADQYIVIDGLVIDATGGVNGVKIRERSNHIRLINVEVKNATHSGILVTDEPGAGNNEFINLNVHNNGSRARYDHGIYVSAPNNLVEGGRFYNNAAFGIQLDQGASSNNIIRYNRVYNNNVVGDGGGIVVADGENNLLAYNLIYDNSGLGGLYVAYGATDTKVFNNTCIDHAYWYKGTRGEVKNNLVTGTLRLEETAGLIVSINLTVEPILEVHNSGTTFHGNLIGNPQFVNRAANDYRITAASPAIDKGVSLGLTRDFNGDSIVGAPDIGALEFHP